MCPLGFSHRNLTLRFLTNSAMRKPKLKCIKSCVNYPGISTSFNKFPMNIVKNVHFNEMSTLLSWNDLFKNVNIILHIFLGDNAGIFVPRDRKALEWYIYVALCLRHRVRRAFIILTIEHSPYTLLRNMIWILHVFKYFFAFTKTKLSTDRHLYYFLLEICEYNI